jgi:type III secretion protein T
MEHLTIPESTFLNTLLSDPNLNPYKLLSLFFMGLMRFAPIAGLAPFMGAKVMPVPARVGLAVFLSILFIPVMLTTSTGPFPEDAVIFGYLLKELIIGLVLAYVVSVPFYIAQSSGIIIDFMRGSSQLMAQDPTMQNQASSIGVLYNYILIVMFFEMDGLLLFLDGVQTSFSLLPVNELVPARFLSLTHQPYLFLSDILGKIFALAIQLGAPSILAILMAEFFLGIANRMAPQVQIAFLGMSLKSLMGLFLLWAGWQFILKNVIHESLNFIKMTNHLAESLIRLSSPTSL